MKEKIMLKSIFPSVTPLKLSLLLLASFWHQSGFSQLDALSLESAPVQPSAAKEKPGGGLKLSFEGALSLASRRLAAGDSTSGRLSVDLIYSKALQPGLRVTVSDRIDALSSAEPGNSHIVHSLREAYLSWRPAGSDDIDIDIGRVNTRGGQGYGYSPTDFFRDGSLRLVTSADPVSNRQNRLGTVMFRAQRVWNEGGATMIWAPGLAKRETAGGWSADFGATNHVDRLLLSTGFRLSENSNAQLILLKRGGMPVTLGANGSALISDKATVHVELTRGREPSLLDLTGIRSDAAASRSRLTAGLTYTASTGTIITTEYLYNGFGVARSVWPSLSQADQTSYLREALRLQELASRRGALVHVMQKDFIMKGLEVSGYFKSNLDDHSSLLWLEARRRWTDIEAAIQGYWANGGRSTEYGLLPERRKLQFLLTYQY